MVDKVYKIKLKKGDTVQVRRGKYRGKTGKITAVYPLLNKVTIEGINVVKRSVKPSRAQPRGGIVEITKPVWVSKVAIIEPTSKKKSKIGYKQGRDGKKIRVYKSTGKEIHPPKLSGRKS